MTTSNLKKMKIAHYINPKRKFIPPSQECARGPRFKVSSEGLSTEIDIPIQSPIQILIEADVA